MGTRSMNSSHDGLARSINLSHDGSQAGAASPSAFAHIAAAMGVNSMSSETTSSSLPENMSAFPNQTPVSMQTMDPYVALLFSAQQIVTTQLDRLQEAGDRFYEA